MNENKILKLFMYFVVLFKSRNMKKQMNILLLSLIWAINLSAQINQPVNKHWCGSIEMMDANFKKHPELKTQFDEIQAQLNALQETQHSANKLIATTNYTIPVVFHILHAYGSENISDAQVADAIAILNRDFNKQNADTSVVIAPMIPAIGNAHINFALARKDPNGNCTSGIVRHFDPKTYNWEGDYQDYIYTWDPTMYLNVYVVKTIASGAAGYAYYPGSLFNGSPMDAILILSNYVGSIGTSNVNQSRALTHEVGHWLNLQHVWGNSNNPGVACGNDQVNDTPITKGYTSCSTLANSQICTPGVSENYQNYMDYAYCSVMFTNGQCTRMNNAINSSTVGRDNLGSTSNLIATGINPVATCPPIALFKSNKQMICVGEQITYTDQSNVSTPTAWNWTFEGGTPNVSTVQNPIVTYNTPGTYSVQLIASNANGSSNPEVKIKYITVLPPTTSVNLVEGFESSPLPNSTWLTRNVSANDANWEQTSLAWASGNHSAYVSENAASSSTVELYSPSFDFTQMPNPVFTFKWAGADRDTITHNSDAQISVFISTNCGVTWVPRIVKNLKYFAAGVSGLENGNFIPSPSQFVQETINVSAFTNSPNVLVRFRYISDYGTSNNFYLDDINIQSVVTGVSEVNKEHLNLLIYPNPANEALYVNFEIEDEAQIDAQLLNALGQTLIEKNKQLCTKGSNTITFNTSNLSKGVYFLKIVKDNTIFMEKVIIE